MGEHSAQTRTQTVLQAVWAQRRKIAGVLVVALPVVARYWPDFPTDQLLTLVRAVLGA